MSKDRARPFSRKHRKYWITITGGMILIGILNVALGFCSYTPPSDVHERIVPDVPFARGSGQVARAIAAAVACAPAITARVAAELPGSTIIRCTPERVTVVRGAGVAQRDAPREIELEVAGDEIRAVAETLTLPEIPTAVMHAFAVAYPRNIPSRATKRTRRGGEPVYELAFPPGAPHAMAILRADGSLVELR